MNSIVALTLLVVASSLIVESEAQWWGGYGWGGYGGFGGWGFGYPFYGYGFYGKRSAVQEPEMLDDKRALRFVRGSLANQTICTFHVDNSVLTCHGVTFPQGVDCPVKVDIDDLSKIDFARYGVSWINKDEKEISMIKFSLSPRKLDDSTYLSNLVTVNGIEAQTALFYGSSPIPGFVGLRVLDSACYSKIVQIFQNSLRSETVSLESLQTDKPSVSIVGEILVVPAKRI